MIRMSIANIASDQSGYAGATISWPIAFNPALTIPIQRANSLPASSVRAANPWSTPRQRTIQPHVFRSLKT